MNVSSSGMGHTIDDIARALVRPLVTLIFAVAFVAFTFRGLVSGEVFASVAGMVFAFWFGSRNQEKLEENATALSTEIVRKLPGVTTLP